MAIKFAENSGINDDVFKDVDLKVRSIMLDADAEKTDYDKALSAMYNVEKSDRFGEKRSSFTEFGDFEIVPEGSEGIQDELQQGFNKIIIHQQAIKTFTVTKTMIEDNQFPEIKKRAMNFVQAYKRSRLREATALMVNATQSRVNWGGFSHDVTTGDGLPLFATNHPGVKAGVPTQSNLFTDAFGTNDSVLFELAERGKNFLNQSGEVMDYEFDTLMIPGNAAALKRTALKIIGSEGEVGNDYNDINVSKGIWKLVVNPFWRVDTSQKIPFIILSSQANKELDGSMFYDRVPLEVDEWVEHKTQDLNFTGRYRAGCGHNIWQHAIMGGAASGSSL